MNESADTVYFLIPGDLDSRTGGYLYDKRIAQGLRALGRPVELVSLEGDYPAPDAAALASAEKQLANLPDGALVLLDGLAGGVMQSQLARHSRRLRLVALVHHPLALETGISAVEADRLKSAETDALSHVHRIITTSQTTSESLKDYAVNTDDVISVCPGTDPAPLAAGSADGGIKLLCVATLTRRKGHSVLFDALAQLRELPWSLTCAGSHERDPETAQSLFLQVDALELKHRVEFLGEVDQDRLDQLYQQADLFVLASYHEGYGMVLDEAVARGLPIIASNGGAIGRTVPDGAGLLSAPGDADALASHLRQFIENSDTRSALHQAARQARDKLRTWDQAAMEFNEALSW